MTEPHAAAVMGEFIRVQETFAQLSDAVQPSHMGVESQNCLDWIVNYLYADLSYYDAFKLILCCSEGTPYQHFMHQMVEVEVEATYQFLDTLRRLGRIVPKIDRQLCHILSSGMFCGFFEISWCTICRRNRQSSMSPLCGHSIRPDGKN